MTRGNARPEISQDPDEDICRVLDTCPPPETASIQPALRQKLRGSEGSFYPCGSYPSVAKGSRMLTAAVAASGSALSA